MGFFRAGKGLVPAIAALPERREDTCVTTEEAAVLPPAGPILHVTPLVAEGDRVAQGEAVAHLRHAPGIRLTAPIAGTVARIVMRPGRRLVEIVLFRDGDAVVRHETSDQTPDGLRRLFKASGVWPLLRRRPFGGMPDAEEAPAAILVMATDTRPGAPDPGGALEGREEDFARGVGALQKLTDGPVIVFAQADALPTGLSLSAQVVHRGRRHPQGLPGICCHEVFPAGLGAPVWDIHSEDVAAMGALLDTGVLPVMRQVRIGGTGLREGRSLRTHPGADLRQLTRRIVAPGPHTILSGSALDGQVGHWLAPRDRQVTVLPAQGPARPRHWLAQALGRSPRGLPAIPTAGLEQAFAGTLPAAPFLRALGAGDDETAMKLGVLSLLEEDVALADYVLSENGEIATQLRTMLDHIRSEFAA